MPQNVPSFDELFEATQRSAVHLEMRDRYAVGQPGTQLSQRRVLPGSLLLHLSPPLVGASAFIFPRRTLTHTVFATSGHINAANHRDVCRAEARPQTGQHRMPGTRSLPRPAGRV